MPVDPQNQALYEDFARRRAITPERQTVINELIRRGALKPLDYDEGAVNKLLQDPNWFNTPNPTANDPVKAAHALAKNPDDPQWKPRLAKMSPNFREAVIRSAQALRGYGQTSMSRASGSEQPAPPLPTSFRLAEESKYSPPAGKELEYGQRIASLEQQSAAEKQQRHAPGGVADSLRSAARSLMLSLVDPQNTALAAASGGVPALGRGLGAAFGSQVLKGAHDKWQQGDKAGAVFDTGLGSLMLFGAAKGYDSPEQALAKADAKIDARIEQVSNELVHPGTPVARKLELQKELAALRDYRYNGPPGKPGNKSGKDLILAKDASLYPRTRLPKQFKQIEGRGQPIVPPAPEYVGGKRTNVARTKGVPLPGPTLPAMSPVDTSQPIEGAEGYAPLGRPPFATTYQTLEPSSERFRIAPKEEEDAVPERGTAPVLQRQPEEAGGAGSGRGRVERGEQGQEVAGAQSQVHDEAPPSGARRPKGPAAPNQAVQPGLEAYGPGKSDAAASDDEEALGLAWPHVGERYQGPGKSDRFIVQKGGVTATGLPGYSILDTLTGKTRKAGTSRLSIQMAVEGALRDEVPPNAKVDVEAQDIARAQEHPSYKAADTYFNGAKRPSVSQVRGRLSKLEAEGFDTSAAEDALDEYEGIEREGYGSSEEYQADREDAWKNFTAEFRSSTGLPDESELAQMRQDEAAAKRLSGRGKQSEAGFVSLPHVSRQEVIDGLHDLARSTVDFTHYMGQVAARSGSTSKETAAAIWNYARDTARPGASAKLSLPTGEGLEFVRNKVYKGMSVLENRKPKSWVAATRYGTSFVSAGEEARIAAKNVLGKLNDQDTKDRFQYYLVADRIYSRLEKLKNEYAGANPQRQAEIKSEVAALHRPTDPVTGAPVRAADVRAYFQRPDVQAAVSVHRSEVEPKLRQANIDYGFDPQGDRGRFSGAWTPAIAADEHGEPMSFTGPSTSGLTKAKPLTKRPDARFAFSGSSDYYMGDYQGAITNRMRNAYRAGNAAVMWRQLLKDGVATADKVSPDQVPMRVEHKTGKAVTGVPEVVYVDRNYAPELNSIWEANLKSDVEQRAAEAMSKNIMWNLWGVAEGINHGAALGGRTGLIVPNLGKDSFIGRLSKLTPQTRSVRAVYELFRNGGSASVTPDELDAATTLAARYGALKTDLPKKGGGLYGATSRFLYGERGIHTKALGLIYKYGKDQGWSNVAIGKTMQELNVHADFLRSSAEKNLRRIHMGTFYQTGMVNRAVGLRYGLGIGQLTGGILLYSAIQRATDPDGHHWWERPGQRFGEFKIGETEEGKPVYLNAWGWLNRPEAYALQVPSNVAENVVQGSNAKEVGMSAAIMAGNEAVGPATSGPGVGALVGSGLSPYIPYGVLNDRETGWKPLDNPVEQTEPFSFDRLRAFATGVFPTATGAVGDVAQEVKSNRLTGGYELLRRYLRVAGGPTLRAGEDPETVTARVITHRSKAAAMQGKSRQRQESAP